MNHFGAKRGLLAEIESACLTLSELIAVANSAGRRQPVERQFASCASVITHAKRNREGTATNCSVANCETPYQLSNFFGFLNLILGFLASSGLSSSISGSFLEITFDQLD